MDRTRALILVDVAESAERFQGLGLQLARADVALPSLVEELGNVATAIVSGEGYREALIALAGHAVEVAAAVTEAPDGT